MTDDELKELVASLAVDNKELKGYQKETDRKIQRLSELYGNVAQNQGDVAEDFFFNSLIDDLHLGEINFDDITKGMFKHRGNIQEEYDLFLTNGDCVAIIEVKYKAHLKDVDKLDRKFNNFKKLYPIYKDYKLYGAMASFYFNDDVKSELLSRGYFVLERKGDLIHSENSDYLKVA